MKKIFIFCVFLNLFAEIFSAEINGVVISVKDGDTVTVLDDLDKCCFRIRLYGIDAPEIKQDFGMESRQYLTRLVSGKHVSVRFRSVDVYGRITGRIYLDGNDISLKMLSMGYAWHYRKYDKTEEYRKAENTARESGTGLWSDKKPIPPWEYRKRKK